MDFIYIIGGFGFFAACIGLIVLCEKLMEERA